MQPTNANKAANRADKWFFEKGIFTLIPSLLGVAAGRGESDMVKKGIIKFTDDGHYFTQPGIFYNIGAAFQSSWWIFLIIAFLIHQWVSYLRWLEKNELPTDFTDDAYKWVVAGCFIGFFFFDWIGPV